MAAEIAPGMGRGCLYTMPLLVINLGCEMVYILEQRLNAQKVPADRKIKVLSDVVRTMYSPKFVSELMKPQAMYTGRSMKQIFDKLAHSSIMRLNESSMDKLYDLMTMGFKFQMLSCTAAEQIMHVTLLHLATLKVIVSNSEAVLALVQSAEDMCMQLYSTMTHGDWSLIKRLLCTFFQGRKVKVSLFLQHNIQSNTGVLSLRRDGPLPAGTEMPGTVTVFERNQAVDFQPFNAPVAEGCLPHDKYEEDGPLGMPLGANLYATGESKENRPKAPSFTVAQAKETDASAFDSSSPSAAYDAHAASKGPSPAKARPSAKAAAKAAPLNAEMKSASAKSELSMLANLMGSAAADTEAAAKDGGGGGGASSATGAIFRINLFQGDDPFADYAAADDKASVQTTRLDATADRKTMAKRMDELDLSDKRAGEVDIAPAKADYDDDEDDLLAMMDAASGHK